MNSDERGLRTNRLSAPIFLGRLWFYSTAMIIENFEDGTKRMVHPKPGDLWPPDGHEHVTSGPQTGALRKKA